MSTQGIVGGTKPSDVTVSMVTIPIKAEGIKIEGFLHMPSSYVKSSSESSIGEDATRVRTAVVVTHPHPKLGGDAENNVTVAIARAISRGMGYPTLRFNTRGVEGSTGSSSWFGTNEANDVIAVCSWLTDPNGAVRAKRIYIVGYSFGACATGTALSTIFQLRPDDSSSSSSSSSSSTSSDTSSSSSSSSTSSRPRMKLPLYPHPLSQYIAGAAFISYPCGFFARFLLGGHISSLRSLTAASSLPLTFVTGTADELTSSSTLADMVRSLDAANATLTVVPDGTHTWFGDEKRVAEPVMHFINKQQQQLDRVDALRSSSTSSSSFSSSLLKGDDDSSSAPSTLAQAVQSTIVKASYGTTTTMNQVHFFRPIVRGSSTFEVMNDCNAWAAIAIVVLLLYFMLQSKTFTQILR